MPDKWRKQGEALFLDEYPNADPSKFDFGYNLDASAEKLKSIDIYYKSGPKYSDLIDVKSGKFKEGWRRYLGSPNPFPKIWRSGGTTPKLLLTDQPSEIRFVDKKKRFPPYVINYPVNDFLIWVDNETSFKSSLPEIVIDTKKSYRDGEYGNLKNTVWTLTKNYYQALASMYIATYKCGVSLEHLTPSTNVPKQITSLMRFHVYITMRRLMFRMDKGGDEIRNIIRLYGATEIRWHLPLGGDYSMYIKDPSNDYKRYCPLKSDGITDRIGQELLNESIEIYMYALLGSQAKSRQSIGGKRGSAYEVQQAFRNIVEDAVVQYSPSVWINLMNKSIKDTNVILNMCVSPNTWLIPSSMILLKRPIEGYNNKLRVASTTGMKFGVNSEVNYTRVKEPTKEAHNPKGSLSDPKKQPTKEQPVRQTSASLAGDGRRPTTPRRPLVTSRDKPGHTTDLVATLLLSSVGTFLVVRYVL